MCLQRRVEIGVGRLILGEEYGLSRDYIKTTNTNFSKQNCSKTPEKTVELQRFRKLGGFFPELVPNSRGLIAI